MISFGTTNYTPVGPIEQRGSSDQQPTTTSAPNRLQKPQPGAVDTTPNSRWRNRLFGSSRSLKTPQAQPAPPFRPAAQTLPASIKALAERCKPPSDPDQLASALGGLQKFLRENPLQGASAEYKQAAAEAFGVLLNAFPSMPERGSRAMGTDNRDMVMGLVLDNMHALKGIGISLEGHVNWALEKNFNNMNAGSIPPEPVAQTTDHVPVEPIRTPSPVNDGGDLMQRWTENINLVKKLLSSSSDRSRGVALRGLNLFLDNNLSQNAPTPFCEAVLTELSSLLLPEEDGLTLDYTDNVRLKQVALNHLPKLVNNVDVSKFADVLELLVPPTSPSEVAPLPVLSNDEPVLVNASRPLSARTNIILEQNDNDTETRVADAVDLYPPESAPPPRPITPPATYPRIRVDTSGTFSGPRLQFGDPDEPTPTASVQVPPPILRSEWTSRYSDDAGPVIYVNSPRESAAPDMVEVAQPESGPIQTEMPSPIPANDAGNRTTRVQASIDDSDGESVNTEAVRNWEDLHPEYDSIYSSYLEGSAGGNLSEVDRSTTASMEFETAAGASEYTASILSALSSEDGRSSILAPQFAGIRSVTSSATTSSNTSRLSALEDAALPKADDNPVAVGKPALSRSNASAGSTTARFKAKFAKLFNGVTP